MSSLLRTRRAPGPFLLVVMAWLAITGTAVVAHDPGLSSLDVTIRRESVSVSLSLAASDVELLATNGDPRPKVLALAREAIRLSVDGKALSPVGDQVMIQDGAAYVRASFTLEPSAGRPRSLVITSDVPGRVSRGHRQLLLATLNDRLVVEALLDAVAPPVTIDLDNASHRAAGRAWHFLGMGVRHVLSGYDHLLFLAGLILAAHTLRALVGVLTAFTVAHSVSLALVVIGGVHAPAGLVEPLIAGSIVWVGLENLARGVQGPRWLLVFAFGLIHGFGFAGALMELGLGSDALEIALALVLFNAGVEVGQVAAALFVVPFVRLMRSRPRWQAKLMPVCSSAMVIAGGYWLIQRL